MKKLIVILFLSINAIASNTDYVAGDITYKHISGGCPSAKFEITVNISSKIQAVVPDSIYFYFGDGTTEFIKRTDSIFIGNNTVKKVFKTLHTFPSCGYFNLMYFDTLNNQNTQNTSQNNLMKFLISAQVILDPLSTHNDSPFQFNSPVTKIFKNKPFNFNVISSMNGTLVYDSIVHTLFKTYSGSTYSVYIPNGVTQNKYSGEIKWLNPDTVGSYVFIPIVSMYKDGNMIYESSQYYKFDVVNQNPTYIYDSINKVPVNINGFKEILYETGNTYSFSLVYSDLQADSVKLYTYPIDFFITQPITSIIKNNSLKNTMFFSWSPTNLDDRFYPYNFITRCVSFYPNDSVINTYQTVSLKSSTLSGLNEINTTNIAVFPNPTTSYIYINDEKKQFQNSIIEIRNTLGQIVLATKFSSQLNISNLTAGIYYLTIQDSSNKKTVKLIKQ